MLSIRRIYGFGGLRIVATYDPTTSDDSKFGQSPRPMKKLILDMDNSVSETCGR
ncbi:MAG: hypothetical protein O6941_04920 [Planctomycetota bacterium]|nr:hypothetical protein [Planctomycetota bacterium]